MSENNERSALGSLFDRKFRSLNDRADVTATKQSTVRHISPILELSQTFIVQTMRANDQDNGGDTIFIEYIGPDGSLRIVLPPEVANVIARQRDALSTKNRRAAGRAEAARRKAAGIKPAFLKNKKARFTRTEG